MEILLVICNDLDEEFYFVLLDYESFLDNESELVDYYVVRGNNVIGV